MNQKLEAVVYPSKKTIGVVFTLERNQCHNDLNFDFSASGILPIKKEDYDKLFVAVLRGEGLLFSFIGFNVLIPCSAELWLTHNDRVAIKLENHDQRIFIHKVVGK